MLMRQSVVRGGVEWACQDCDRRYQEPPEQCVCGGQLEPAGSATDDDDPLTRVAKNLYLILFEPSAVDRGLLSTGPRVRLAFRLVVALSLLMVALVVVAMLL